MRLTNMILHNEILLIHADINQTDYIFTVKWKTPENKKGGEWELKSYLNNTNGKKDLTEEQIQAFLDQINPKWDWEEEQRQIKQVLDQD
ncbi:hypothetical protein F9U64_00230 [Gracilibacillus oryzae]|uniref:Uncharacterized protein n=1 Tax=Gracilibacillus oryzae TaxID=1672701 RepID=A0A7C8GX75_9BACI|nr:hypothetical protein [Gracilibacillus oryzae]KAB8139407.1 hypothetical protein F9U64_00230 [Gracilibacillus oryzae]